MGIFSFLDPALDFLFGPLLKLTPFWAILLLSFILSLLIVVIYKYATNQTLMKQMREDVKKYQAQMKEHKKDPQKVMEIQKKSMEVNMKLMRHSFRPTLFTILPIIIIFGWVGGHLAFEPIIPGEQFSVTVQTYENIAGNVTVGASPGIEIRSAAVVPIEGERAIFAFKGNEGLHSLQFDLGEKAYTKDILITTARAYEEPLTPIRDKTVRAINVNQEKTIVMNLFGWKLGWIGTYIIFSIIFSMGLRKLLKVY